MEVVARAPHDPGEQLVERQAPRALALGREPPAEELEALFASDGAFTAGDLPGPLDDEGRLVLVRRLIREGFLRRSAAGA